MNDYSFLLKQWVAFFIQPYGLVILLFVLFLIFKYLKKKKASKFSFYTMLFVFGLFSYPPFANFLVTNLEKSYEKYDYAKRVEYIHVLGNGHNDDITQPLSSRIGDVGIKRNLEGIMIHLQTPDSKIVFTGYKGRSSISTAKMNEQFALALGVKQENIIISEKPKDTYEEAMFLKALVDDEPFVLVTSATHMPRAMKTFQELGLNPIAAPTDFRRANVSGYLKLPTAQSFVKSQIAMHEYIGLLWAKLKSVVSI